jgi:hypothetical protein
MSADGKGEDICFEQFDKDKYLVSNKAARDLHFKQGYLKALEDVEGIVKHWQFKYNGEDYAVSRDILLQYIRESRASGEGEK